MSKTNRSNSRRMLLGLFFSVLCVVAGHSSEIWAQAVASPAAKEVDMLETSGFTAFDGFFSFYWDEEQGKVWLRVSDQEKKIRNESFLYVSSLATGLGSNPVGLDRGQLGADRLVHFHRVGQRLYLVQENVKYRAITDNQSERRAVRESFAESVLWSAEIHQADVGLLVDLSSLLIRDAHDCIGALASANQGTYRLDEDRSFIYLPRTKAFPKNSEFEASLTFASTKPGSLARRVAADGRSITLRQHHSFVELPEPGYRPRKWDPRSGCFSISFADYAAGIEDPLEIRWITRHRLQKRNPAAEKSRPLQPIVYYLDPGAPQPVRDALLDGARWWSDAFEEAGFLDAFQVKVLPADADPMDVRFNIIQWVHRATRGWSYGQSFVDPRTGEIIKGHVLLGSLRVRQDHLLMSGLGGDPQKSSNASADRMEGCAIGASPSGAYLAALAPEATSLDVSLARIRQLSAHEVGHTLGFAHNFAASTYADRASVMDYPAPRAEVKGGTIDLSDAYGVGIGEWDKFTVKYAYAELSPEQEEKGLSELIRFALANGYRYVTDADARPAGAAHPYGNLWDNGSDPVAALKQAMEVREIAVANLTPSVLHQDQSLGELEKVFVPIYLHHRYQVEAAAKVLGGYDYTYAFAGDGQTPLRRMGSATQQAALEALLDAIQPQRLVIPQRVLDTMPPKAASSVTDIERFATNTRPLFDPATTIRTAAELVLGSLLQPQRASRLARQSAANDGVDLNSLLTKVVHQVCLDREQLADPSGNPSIGTPAEREARRVVERVLVERMMALCESDSASADARQVTRMHLGRLRSRFLENMQMRQGTKEAAQWSALRAEIDQFRDRAYPPRTYPKTAEVPPGSPIGSTTPE